MVQFKCLFCGDEAKGRTDQRFCNPLCRSRYNNQRTASIRALAETINPRAISYSENVNVLNRLIRDNRLGPYTLNDLVSLGYSSDSPYDKRISDEQCQVTFYGNVRLKKYIGKDWYELSVERQEKKKLRRPSYSMTG